MVNSYVADADAQCRLTELALTSKNEQGYELRDCLI